MLREKIRSSGLVIQGLFHYKRGVKIFLLHRKNKKFVVN